MGNHIVTPTIFCFLLQIVGFCPTFLKCFGQIVGRGIISEAWGDWRINEKLSLMRQPPFDVADAWLIYGFEFVDVVNFFDFSEFYSICPGT